MFRGPRVEPHVACAKFDVFLHPFPVFSDGPKTWGPRVSCSSLNFTQPRASFSAPSILSMAPRMAPKTQAVAKAKTGASASGDRDEGKSKSASGDKSKSAIKPRGYVAQALAAQGPSPKCKYVDKLRAAAVVKSNTLVASGTSNTLVASGTANTLVASGTAGTLNLVKSAYEKRKAQTQRLKIFMKLPENRGEALYGIMKVKDMKLEHLREIQDWKMYPHPHLHGHSFRRKVGHFLAPRPPRHAHNKGKQPATGGKKRDQPLIGKPWRARHDAVVSEVASYAVGLWQRDLGHDVAPGMARHGVMVSASGNGTWDTTWRPTWPDMVSW